MGFFKVHQFLHLLPYRLVTDSHDVFSLHILSLFFCINVMVPMVFTSVFFAGKGMPVCKVHLPVFKVCFTCVPLLNPLLHKHFESECLFIIHMYPYRNHSN